jgi:hypothetical protein
VVAEASRPWRRLTASQQKHVRKLQAEAAEVAVEAAKQGGKTEEEALAFGKRAASKLEPLFSAPPPPRCHQLEQGFADAVVNDPCGPLALGAHMAFCLSVVRGNGREVVSDGGSGGAGGTDKDGAGGAATAPPHLRRAIGGGSMHRKLVELYPELTYFVGAIITPGGCIVEGSQVCGRSTVE